jgi:glycogen synthase
MQDVWDPATDSYLNHHFSIEDAEAGKAKSKMDLCETFSLDFDKPLIVFIGRLVGEKGADLLPQVIVRFILLYRKAHELLNFRKWISGSGSFISIFETNVSV